MSTYYPPEHESREFTCPYCGVYASQNWKQLVVYDEIMEKIGRDPVKNAIFSFPKGEVEVSFCTNCKEATFWLTGNIMYPPPRTAPPANNDLPDDIKQVYDEAAAIADQSPRAACALLRLVIQILLERRGGTGNLNTDIKNLVKEGLRQEIQQALDIVRVTGNHAVHRGEIVFDDTTDVQALFGLINVIADILITTPNQIQEIYDNLPAKDREEIEKRDSKTQ